MPSARRALGDQGEEAAAAHLRARGASILARGWRWQNGEIDLVALLGGQLLFVEVRTRRAGATAPEESVGASKIARMRRSALAYLAAAALPDEPDWRIDLIVVEIDGRGRVTRLEQIEHAVEDG